MTIIKRIKRRARQWACVGFATCALAVLTPSAQAENNWAVAVDAGTTGVGVGVTIGVTPSLNLRAAWRGLSISRDIDAADNNGMQGDELNYAGNLDLRGGHVLLDYYPGVGSFYLSAGGMLNGSQFQVDAQCPPGSSAGCEVGTNPAARVAPGDTLNTDISFPGFAPYVGIGFGNALGKNTGFAWQLDLGVLFQGKAAVDITYGGTCNGTVAAAECQNQVEQEEQELEKELEDFQLYPVLNLGLAYRFP